jgi:hypothetical protein
MLAHLRRQWSLSGREGFGVLSPSCRACEFNAFQEMKCLFSTTPDMKKRRRTEVTEVIGRWTGRDLCLTERVRSVLSVYARLGLLIRRGGASGHVQPNVSDHAWRLTGNDRTLSLWRLVRLACAFGRWLAGALLGLTSASDQSRDQRVRSSFVCIVCAPMRPVSLTSAFSQCGCSRIKCLTASSCWGRL